MVSVGGRPVAELFLSARAVASASTLTHKVEGGKQMWPPKHPGREGVGGPGDKTAGQRVIVGVKARYEKVHNVGDVLGSTHIPRRRGSLVFAASDLDIRHLWLSRSRYGQQYKRRRCYDGPDPIGRLSGARRRRPAPRRAGMHKLRRPIL